MTNMMTPLRLELLGKLESVYAQFEGWKDSAEVAMYWYASDFHDGQFSPLYSLLSTSPYTPSCLTGGIDDEDDQVAVDMYYFIREYLDGPQN